MASRILLAPKRGALYDKQVRIIARRTLREFWAAGHADAKKPLRAWHARARQAKWKSMADIKRDDASASAVNADYVVFNIGGNKYRLVASPWFAGQTLYIKFIGTHRAYDKINVTER